jgi:hypothetical protein
MSYHCCVYGEKLLKMDRGTVPKHVEFYSKNKFENLVHLVGFIVGIYQDAQSYERQIGKVSEREELVHLVGFIVGIYQDARSYLRQICKVSEREELVHLIGFIVGIYQDARSYERQISKVS